MNACSNVAPGGQKMGRPLFKKTNKSILNDNCAFTNGGSAFSLPPRQIVKNNIF